MPESEGETCTTPGCPGDPHFASPGRGHLAECRYPEPWDGEALPSMDPSNWDDGVPPEWRETDAMTEGLAPFMTIVLLFGAAVQGANRDERKALYEARLMLGRDRKPLAEVAQAILDARGPTWAPPTETMEAIEALHRKEN